MRYSRKFLGHLGLLTLAFFTFGCTHESHPELPDAFLIPADAGPRFGPPTPGPDHTCDPDGLLEDFWNCGRCGKVCAPDNADQCFVGVCSCGTGPACDAGSDCRVGRCVAADPSGTICEFDHECLRGFACIESHCTFVECTPEDCDGFDNDCDGTTDEGSTPGMPLSQFCYNGGIPTNPLEIPAPCRPGVQACAGGTWSECFGEVPPLEENGLLACDGEDNNCDGCPDGEVIDGICVPWVFDGFDILYAFDTSGSMRGEIAAVIDATRSFSASLDRPDMRFAIATVPGVSHGFWGEASVVLDFSSFTMFDDMLSYDLPSGVGNEPSWDVVFEAATNTIHRQACSDADADGVLECVVAAPGLSWRERSIRIIILFTDEEGQSYRRERGLDPAGEAEMCASLTHGEVLVVVNELEFHRDFDCGGSTTLFELTEDAATMAANLSSVLVDPCGRE